MNLFAVARKILEFDWSLHMCLLLNVNEHCVRNLQIVLKYQLLAATGRRDIQNCNQLTKQKAVTNMKMARDPPMTTIKMEVFISRFFFRFSIENSWHFYISLWQSCKSSEWIYMKKIRMNIFICKRSDVISNHSEEQLWLLSRLDRLLVFAELRSIIIHILLSIQHYHFYDFYFNSKLSTLNFLQFQFFFKSFLC